MHPRERRTPEKSKAYIYFCLELIAYILASIVVYSIFSSSLTLFVLILTGLFFLVNAYSRLIDVLERANRLRRIKNFKRFV